jgi:hypothetical protein
MIKKLLSTLIAFLIVLIAQSQGVVGEWKDYLSFAKSFDLVRSGEKVYCASEEASFIITQAITALIKFQG